MNKYTERALIQDALNTTLSGLQDDPWLAQRVIAGAKGKAKRRRKLSVGLLLCLVLLLVSTAALALTFLSCKSFAGQATAPMSGVTGDLPWTEEESQTILSLAQKNEIELPGGPAARRKSPFIPPHSP